MVVSEKMSALEKEVEFDWGKTQAIYHLLETIKSVTYFPSAGHLSLPLLAENTPISSTTQCFDITPHAPAFLVIPLGATFQSGLL